MRVYQTIRQIGVAAGHPRSGILGASNPAHRHMHGRQISPAATSTMAFSTDRTNTIGFIGLGAMGHHMVKLHTAQA